MSAFAICVTVFVAVVRWLVVGEKNAREFHPTYCGPRANLGCPVGDDHAVLGLHDDRQLGDLAKDFLRDRAAEDQVAEMFATYFGDHAGFDVYEQLLLPTGETMWVSVQAGDLLVGRESLMMAVGGVEKCVLGTFPCHPQPPAE
jgi:hypothetical protein